ncbi:protein HHL1, chloroplastic-like [Silene latifolia]|uniref:protein HHL1, chloroplastic-like n=1 Tax=Silene latifolia TaxID=37657 RepID=UPI003D76C625
MEVGMSLNPLIRLPMKLNSRTSDESATSIIRHSLHSSSITKKPQRVVSPLQFVVVAKGKRGMMTRQFQPPTPPPLPKIEDDGNPRFVIFIRAANVYLWYPLNLVTGGTTAKIMVAAKDNFLGKYIYKDTLTRNIAAVVYRDEKETIKTAQKQNRMLRNATEFRFGYKILEGTNVRAALSPKNVIELPTPDQLKTVVDKVKDFFGDAKESFGNLTSLDTASSEEVEETSK